jgi:ribosomal-protein-alanine acetyltransferase
MSRRRRPPSAAAVAVATAAAAGAVARAAVPAVPAVPAGPAHRAAVPADAVNPEDAGQPRLIGYAGLLAGVGEAEVLTIAVDPAREGRGLGAVLLTELMREAARRGCDDVVLEVRVDNDRAQRLYRRFGFAGIGVRKGYYQPMNIDALVMRSGDVIARFGAGSGAGGAGGGDAGHGTATTDR